jgi:DNA repair exonuclease SbcCD nuclease subunit
MNLKTEICIIFFADTHLGFDYPIRPKINRRRRGEDFFNNYKKVLNYAIERNADLVVHGGDFFFRSKLPKKVIDMAYKSLFEFADSGIPFLIVPGNHERSILPSSLFLNRPNIFIFNRPKTFSIYINGAAVSVSGFPFERNDIRNQFNSLLTKTGWHEQKADIKLLLMHQTVQGAQVGPSNYTFRYGKDVIKRADIPSNFTAVLSGHIHRQQILMKDHMPIIYPGSTERTSFAEQKEEKGFYEIIFEGMDSQWAILNTKFIELPSRPMQDILLEDYLSRENLESFIQSEIQKMHPDAIIRFKANGNVKGEVIQKLSSRCIRSILPETMNFQLSGNLFRDFKI